MAAFARDAQGPASFTGVFAWDAQDPKNGGATSRGRLVVDRIDFTSPIGFVATLDGTVDFTSLAPLTTAPDQSLKIVKIDSLVPLTAVESVFQLGADALHVSKATFEAAKGRVSIEPTDVPLEPGKTISGAVVIQHLDLGELIAASSLADKVKVQAVIDGRLPFTFGPEGLRFQEGRISAVQPGRDPPGVESVAGPDRIDQRNAADPAVDGPAGRQLMLVRAVATVLDHHEGGAPQRGDGDQHQIGAELGGGRRFGADVGTAHGRVTG